MTLDNGVKFKIFMHVYEERKSKNNRMNGTSLQTVALRMPLLTGTEKEN